MFLLIFSLTCSGNVFAEVNQTTFIGTVGNSEIHMNVSTDSNRKVIGTYYYDAFQKDIMIDGTISSDDSINLTEYDEYGHFRARFCGVFVSPDRIEGVWIDGKKGSIDELPLQVTLYKPDAPPLSSVNINHSWQGRYLRQNGVFSPSTIDISYNTGDSFYFSMKSASGSHTGGVSGVALIKGNSAIFNDGRKGTLTFELDGQKIKIKQSYEMYYYGGMGVGFSGEYVGQNEKLKDVSDIDFTFLNSVQKDTFKSLVQEHYLAFQKTAQFTFPTEDLDNFGAHAYSMAIRGLFTEVESIIMYRDDNKFWAAVIEGNNVYYFTNTNRTKALPRTIEKWRERFKNKPIIYPSN